MITLLTSYNAVIAELTMEALALQHMIDALKRRRDELKDFDFSMSEEIKPEEDNKKESETPEAVHRVLSKLEEVNSEVSPEPHQRKHGDVPRAVLQAVSESLRTSPEVTDRVCLLVPGISRAQIQTCIYNLMRDGRLHKGDDLKLRRVVDGVITEPVSKVDAR